jgi:uncharacterized protein
MAKLQFKDKWVLITGASSGLGRAIALHMARKEQANLVIAARRKERLEQLKQEIESTVDREVKIITADLSRPGDVENLFRQTVETVNLYAIINNAGLTFYGKTTTEHFETYNNIIEVNLKALITLSLKFLEWFEARGEGAILNVTSEAGMVPVPYQLVYSASKHAAQVFTEGLRVENRNSNVTISSFAPGGIATEMLTKSGLDKKHGLDSPFNMNVDKAATLAIKCFKKKKFVVVPGLMNKITVLLTRFLPRRLVVTASEKVYRPE